MKLQNPILLVTATGVETRAVHAIMEPVPELSELRPIYQNQLTYFEGKIGSYRVVHVQSEMGSSAISGSQLTVNQAILDWDPAAVIMVGIAFGADPKDLKIGDVLVSRQIVPYEPKRVGANATIPRGIPIPAGVVLLNRFSNCPQWNYILPDGIPSKVHVGAILSGEVLIDNTDYKSDLLQEFPTAIGGEMEGAGLSAASQFHAKQWIIVKGVCDYADGNKSQDKKQRQLAAASAAASLCQHVLCSPNSLDDLEPCKIALDSTVVGPPISDVLFAVYQPSLEPYYLERDLDGDVARRLAQSNIWMWGASGVGKTSLLLRNVQKSTNKMLFIDLSGSVNAGLAGLLEDIFWQVSDALSIGATRQNPSKGKETAYWLRAITSLIANGIPAETTLLIDEFSAAPTKDFDNFISVAADLVVKLTNLSQPRNFRLALASTQQPFSTAHPNYSKLIQRVPLLHITKWTEDELSALAKKLQPHLPQYLNDSDVVELAKAANGCPRRLKVIVDAHILQKQTPNWTLLDTVRSIKSYLQ